MIMITHLVLKSRLRCWLIGLLVLLAGSCNSAPDGSQGIDENKTGETVDGIRIAWDYSSMQKLAPPGNPTSVWAGYPRIRRLNDGTLMAVYETQGNGEMVQSNDNGATWSQPVSTFKKHRITNENEASTDVNIANTELCQLQNGDLVMACNYRPATAEIAPFAIAVRRSSDMGKTWGADQVIFEAAPRFKDGCWEPSFLQLPNGELQVYFANEAPYLTSDEQNISMIASKDNGITWAKEPKTVCFRSGRRDGMPVALLVGDEILVSVEDNKSGQFKPAIVRTSIADNWSTTVLANSTRREYALKVPLPDEVYAGAPYIVRVPSGEVILSYQTTRGRSTNWELSTLEVAIGDKKGRNFEKITQPFNVPADREAKWNSLALWDPNTIVAAATTSFRNPTCEVWIIKGHLLTELKIMPATIVVDGNISVPEWGSRLPLFIGHRSETNLQAAIRRGEQTLYFCASVKDQKLVATSDDPLHSDGVHFYIDTESQKSEAPKTSIYRIWCNYKGETKIFKGARGIWNEIKNNQLVAKTRTNADGYELEIAVPFSLINKKTNDGIRLNLGLVEYSSPSNSYEENIVNSDAVSPDSWMFAAFDE